MWLLDFLGAGGTLQVPVLCADWQQMVVWLLFCVCGVLNPLQVLASAQAAAQDSLNCVWYQPKILAGLEAIPGPLAEQE